MGSVSAQGDLQNAEGGHVHGVYQGRPRHCCGMSLRQTLLARWPLHILAYPQKPFHLFAAVRKKLAQTGPAFPSQVTTPFAGTTGNSSEFPQPTQIVKQSKHASTNPDLQVNKLIMPYSQQIKKMDQKLNTSYCH